MVAVVAQIESVIPVRARVVNTEVLPQVTDEAPADISGQATGAVAQATVNGTLAAKAPRRAPITNDQEIRLTVNSDTHEVIATLVDTQTNEVIREIPPEDMRRAAEVIRAIIGQIVDKVA